jgi:peptide chain release factor 2
MGRRRRTSRARRALAFCYTAPPWKSARSAIAPQSSKNASPLSGGFFDVDGKRSKIAELDERTSAPDFWNENDKAQATLKEQAKLKAVVDDFDTQCKAVEDARILLELADEAKDEATVAEAATTLSRAESAVDKMEFARMLSGPYDRQGALVSINAGAGGTESQDWAQMLQRMYMRWAARRGFECEVLDLQPGDEAGIKSATMSIQGEWAYGYLRAEAGVHRLVRISPFDSQARRHTSFASVFVYPDIDETVKVDIDEKDLRVETMRSGGAGGQHVNKTESAIRITHVPTGIAVHCQSERSQHKNRSTAMRILRSKLMELEQRKMEEKMGGIHAQKKAIEWGSQIRSYVLAPYRMASDHRTELKVSNVDAVLDGDLDPFMIKMLLQLAGDPSAQPTSKAGADPHQDEP